ncbi:MAG: DinB-like domain protein [Gemmatimonadetes bacterium]|nr:DinB-like domain protein [Gemmatimonadota bacterium]
MHPRTAELLAYLDEHHAVLRGAFDAVPADRRNRRPASDQWSATDVITHLTLVQRRIATVFAKSVEEARARGLGAEADASPVLPTLDTARFVDRGRKIAGPERINPIHTGDSLEWSDFETAHAALEAALLQGDGLALSEITAPHPMFGAMGMYEWIAFAGAHCSRHAAQLREIEVATRE